MSTQMKLYNFVSNSLNSIFLPDATEPKKPLPNPARNPNLKAIKVTKVEKVKNKIIKGKATPKSRLMGSLMKTFLKRWKVFSETPQMMGNYSFPRCSQSLFLNNLNRNQLKTEGKIRHSNWRCLFMAVLLYQWETWIFGVIVYFQLLVLLLWYSKSRKVSIWGFQLRGRVHANEYLKIPLIMLCFFILLLFN